MFRFNRWFVKTDDGRYLFYPWGKYGNYIELRNEKFLFRVKVIIISWFVTFVALTPVAESYIGQLGLLVIFAISMFVYFAITKLITRYYGVTAT